VTVDSVRKFSGRANRTGGKKQRLKCWRLYISKDFRQFPEHKELKGLLTKNGPNWQAKMNMYPLFSRLGASVRKRKPSIIGKAKYCWQFQAGVIPCQVFLSNGNQASGQHYRYKFRDNFAPETLGMAFKAVMAGLENSANKRAAER
jgi:hypothetical protein